MTNGPNQYEQQAMRRCRGFLLGLSGRWQPLDLAELDRLGSALLWMATATGLVECRFQCKAWTDAASVEAEMTVVGLWLDAAGASVLPAEFRKAVPAWEHKPVAVQIAPVIETRLTRSGTEAHVELQAHEDRTWLTMAYMTTQPRAATVKLRLMGEAAGPGAVPGIAGATTDQEVSQAGDQVEVPGMLGAPGGPGGMAELLKAVTSLTAEVQALRQTMGRTSAAGSAMGGEARAADAAGEKPAKRGPDPLPLEQAWRYLTIVQEWTGIQEQNKKRPMRDRYQKVQMAEKHGISVKELDAMLAWYRKNRSAGRFPVDPRTLSKGELKESFA